MYNDFATMEESKFEKARTEYNSILKASVMENSANYDNLQKNINETKSQIKNLYKISKNSLNKQKISEIMVNFEQLVEKISSNTNCKLIIETNSQQIFGNIYCNCVKQVLFSLLEFMSCLNENKLIDSYMIEVKNLFAKTLDLIGECRYRW